MCTSLIYALVRWFWLYDHHTADLLCRGYTVAVVIQVVIEV